ncbi:protein lifeguard 3-like [Sphaerodactylus townsendi]|uniref:protein lifeguard 3-like n=1 Tax=Sphaerodactylus townsendi TaxID=933632 RepID=UPI002025D141|nr:protein lifeguard 3-like [Sphaerodactylus townsendi]XP_048342831.1 protein lifeguard 3-like [Sphaerodactylus townsendi]XP_048342832.1 protein lifeguard 3-like [Sphaerodactylus townsendi]XP_048342833.1 protein lifeguard 3-like [Sphaerodactylus townsendi]
MSNPSCPTSYEAKDPLLLAPYDEYSGGYPAGCSRADSQPPPYSVVYPQPGGYPQSVPPVETLSANFSDRPNSSGMAVDWDSKKVQHAFIRKVYSIISVQLLVTVGIVAIFIFVTPVTSFVQNNIAVYYGSYAVFLVTYLVLVCCEGLRRRFPWNIIFLCVFTLAMAFMTGTISSMYSTKAVLLAMIITAIVAITVTVFSFQTKVDFTSCTGLFCVLAIVVMVTGIITAIVLSFKYVYWLHMLYAAIGAIVFTLFLAYDTQLLLGNKKYTISPEDYIVGALEIYLDVVYIFTFFLQLTGRRS